MTDEELDELVAQKVREAFDKAGRVLVVPAKEALRHEFQQRTVEKLLRDVRDAIEDSTSWTVMRFLLAHEDNPPSHAQLSAALSLNNLQANAALKKLTDAGLATKGGGQNKKAVTYSPNVRGLVVKSLEPHAPKEADVEDTYQAVLGRLAS